MVVAVTIGAGLSACSATDPEDDAHLPGPTSPEPAVTASATAEPETTRGPVNRPPRSPEFGGVQGDVIVAGDIVNDPSLYEGVALTECGSTGDGWSAGGTASSHDGQQRTLLIVVHITDPQARAIGSATATVEVLPHTDQDWEARADIPGVEDGQCVIMGVSSLDSR